GRRVRQIGGVVGERAPQFDDAHGRAHLRVLEIVATLPQATDDRQHVHVGDRREVIHQFGFPPSGTAACANAICCSTTWRRWIRAMECHGIVITLLMNMPSDLTLLHHATKPRSSLALSMLMLKSNFSPVRSTISH